MQKKTKSDIALQIIRHLKKADRPLIAHHIAKGIKGRPQLVDYHLKKLVEKGVVLITREYDHFYYFLQPSFYMEEAETALMQITLPWVEEFAKLTEKTEEMENKEPAVLNSLYYYFVLFLEDIAKEIGNKT